MSIKERLKVAREGIDAVFQIADGHIPVDTPLGANVVDALKALAETVTGLINILDDQREPELGHSPASASFQRVNQGLAAEVEADIRATIARHGPVHVLQVLRDDYKKVIMCAEAKRVSRGEYLRLLEAMVAVDKAVIAIDYSIVNDDTQLAEALGQGKKTP